MHLLPFKDYSAKEVDLKRKVKAINGGWPARSLPLGKEGSEVLGNIPTGTEFEVIKEEKSADGKYKFAYGRITKGSFSNKKIDDCVWFAIEENGEAIKNNKGSNRLQDIPPPERTTPGYWHGTVKATVTALRGLKVRGAPTGEKAGPQLAPQQVLCTGSTIEFDSAKIKWLTLEDGERYPMAECKFIPGDGAGLKGEGVLPPTFWCCVSDTGAKPFITRKGVVPTRFDSVVLTNTAIKAGEPIGYMGLYESPASAKGGVNSKHQVHVEIFSADSGLESFLKNPAGILDGRKYIIVSKGQKLASKGGSSEKPIFAEQTVPLEEKLIVALGQAKKIKDVQGKEWFEITTPGPEKKIAGYINKEKCEIVCQHDWERLGFTVVKENSQKADGFLDPEQMPKFFQELYKEVDSDGDSNINPGELQASLRDTSIRDKWSKLIGYHPTEWQAKSSEPKWEKLKVLLEDSPSLLKHEQGRIDDLVFWDEMAGSMQIALPSQVYHFHPIGFIANLKLDGPVAHDGLFTVADGKAAIKVIYEKYGKEMAIIVERMYRDETKHFRSGQYEHCGTGGMEAFGKPPYYGWDGSIFEAHPEYAPVGTWSAFENPGMSGQGGNKQVTDRKKVFVVLPSVLAGMEYKAAYINRYDGNWARWHSKDAATQANYKKHIEAIRARFVEELEAGE